MKNEVVINPMPAVPGRRFLLANIAALGGGQAVAVGLSLLTLPIYVAVLGAEGLGLIGFTVLLSTLLRVFDMGMTASVSRQIASLRGSGQSSAQAQTGDFMRTFELLFVGMAVVLAAMLSAGSPLIARFWLKSESFGSCPAWVIVVLIACLASVRWVIGFYHACLRGLERQKLSSLLRVSEVLLLHIVAVFLLLFVSGEVAVYFVWMAISSLMMLGAVGVTAWRCSPGRFWASRFGWHHIRAVWRFALGVAGVTVVSVVLTQLDRIVVSAVVSLEQFGYYTTAVMAIGMLHAVFVMPLFNTIYPRFSALVSSGNEAALRVQYLFAGVMLQGLLLPIAAVAFIYGEPIVWVWTQNKALSTSAGVLLGWLSLSLAFTSLSVPAYTLQLARGRTSLVASNALVLTIVAGPVFWWACKVHGMYGLSIAVAAIQLAASVILVPLTHRRMLRGLMGRYLGKSVLPAMVGAVLCGAVLHWLPQPEGSRVLMGGWIAAAMVCSWAVTLGLCGLWSGEMHLVLEMLRGMSGRLVGRRPQLTTTDGASE